jgi:hypothetical protein
MHPPDWFYHNNAFIKKVRNYSPVILAMDWRESSAVDGKRW